MAKPKDADSRIPLRYRTIKVSSWTLSFLEWVLMCYKYDRCYSTEQNKEVDYHVNRIRNELKQMGL